MISALVTVSIAVLISLLPKYLGRDVEPLVATPYNPGEDVEATAYNITIFFLLLVTATAFIYIVFAKKRVFKAFLYFVWFILSSGVVQFYTVMYYQSGIISESLAALLIWLSLPLGVSVVYLIYKRRGDLILGFLGALAGAMLAWVLPSATVLAMLAILPAYDYVMVKRGLLGKLIQKSREVAPSDVNSGRPDTPLFGFVVRLKTSALGVGDFVVYAMALTFLAVRFNQINPLASLAAVLVGCVAIYLGLQVTFRIFLKKWGYGPALPAPILMMSPLLAAAWFL